MSTTTTETVVQRKIVPVATTTGLSEKDRHHEELVSRGLLNSDLPMVKKVVGEQAVIGLAGLTAVLLQVAHPGVGKGVGNHSSFARRFIERHERTIMYIYTMIWGSEDERAKMKSFVSKRHKYVNDKKRENSYDALDPELQLWVAITLYATYKPVYEDIFGKLSDADNEQLLQEFSVMGTSLQVPLHMWPRSVAEFDTYYNHIVNNVLEETPQCRKTANELRNAASYVPWYLKPFMAINVPLVWNASIENMPESVRKIYGVVSTAWTRALHYYGMAYLRLVYPMLPVSIRTSAVNRYMTKARMMMAKGTIS